MLGDDVVPTQVSAHGVTELVQNFGVDDTHDVQLILYVGGGYPVTSWMNVEKMEGAPPTTLPTSVPPTTANRRTRRRAPASGLYSRYLSNLPTGEPSRTMPDADTRAKVLCTGSVYAIRTVLNLDATSRRARYDVRGDSTAIVQA